jgi:hypothetical protein
MLLNLTNDYRSEVVVRAPYPAVLSEAAAMSNADGEVIPFSSAEVHQPLKAAGK